MRLLVSALLVSACFVACTRAYPAFDTSDDSDESKNVDTTLVLPGSGRDLIGRPRISDIPDMSDFNLRSEFQDSEESSSFFRPNYPKLYIEDYLTQALGGLIKRLRDQMSDIASNLPSPLNTVRFWKIPEGGNTTSTTKVIDGHMITINETIYNASDDNGSNFIRIRTIDVKPQNETTESDQSPSTTPADVANEPDLNEDATVPSRSVETVEDINNEIPKNTDSLTA